eukprot:7357313-Ditylum_brightwellii.AAC.1
MVLVSTKTAPMSRGQLLPSSNLKPGNSREGSTTLTSCVQPQQTLHHLSTSSLYRSLIMGHPKSGSNSGAGYKQCSRDRTLHRDPQATQLQRCYLKAML